MQEEFIDHMLCGEMPFLLDFVLFGENMSMFETFSFKIHSLTGAKKQVGITADLMKKKDFFEF